MKVMEDIYNLYASEKQYKTKIKEWNLTKNVNEDQMDCMLRKEKRRKEREGKATVFMFKGRKVEHEKLDRFRKRRKLQDDEIGSTTVSTASHVQYYTPHGRSPQATLARLSPERTGSETGSSLASSTTNSGSRSTTTSGSLLLRLKWNGLDMRALRDMRRRADTLINNSNPTDAAEILRQVLSGYEYLLGPDQEDVFEVIGTMGLACYQSGNYSEAEALLLRAVSGFEEIHGPDDGRALVAAANLAQLYKNQGRYEDSELLYVRVIKGFEQLCDPANKLNLLSMMRDLAFVCARQGYNAKACDSYRRVITGYRSLGAGYEDPLLQVEIDSANFRFTAQGPEPESGLIDLLARCEVRFGTEHSRVLEVLDAIISLYYARGKFDKLELYSQRLLLKICKSLDANETLDSVTSYMGMRLAALYSERERYEEAESLFERITFKTEELTISLDKGCIDNTWKRRHFETVGLHALHYIRQSRWDDAEPLLLKAKSLEEPFCSRSASSALLTALEQFRIGSGREAGAIPLTQRTHDTEVQSPQPMPNNPPEETRTFEPADALISVGLSEFQQPLEEIDWSGFPLPSPSAQSLPWSPPGL